MLTQFYLLLSDVSRNGSGGKFCMIYIETLHSQNVRWWWFDWERQLKIEWVDHDEKHNWVMNWSFQRRKHPWDVDIGHLWGSASIYNKLQKTERHKSKQKWRPNKMLFQTVILCKKLESQKKISVMFHFTLFSWMIREVSKVNHSSCVCVCVQVHKPLCAQVWGCQWTISALGIILQECLPCGFWNKA